MCQKETQIERTMLRDKVSREHAEHILAAQATREQRLAVADDVIENTGTPDAVASDVARLHEKYLMLASQAASQEKLVMHTPVLFEHPLNEKMRTWLRIEFLIQQMAFHPMIATHADALHFFRNAGDLLDVLERGEVRTDLVKELERQQRKLQSWAEVPGVDQERINELRQQLKQSSSTLMAAPRIGQFLREDRP